MHSLCHEQSNRINGRMLLLSVPVCQSTFGVTSPWRGLRKENPRRYFCRRRDMRRAPVAGGTVDVDLCFAEGLAVLVLLQRSSGSLERDPSFKRGTPDDSAPRSYRRDGGAAPALSFALPAGLPGGRSRRTAPAPAIKQPTRDELDQARKWLEQAAASAAGLSDDARAAACAGIAEARAGPAMWAGRRRPPRCRATRMTRDTPFGWWRRPRRRRGMWRGRGRPPTRSRPGSRRLMRIAILRRPESRRAICRGAGRGRAGERGRRCGDGQDRAAEDAAGRCRGDGRRRRSGGSAEDRRRDRPALRQGDGAAPGGGRPGPRRRHRRGQAGSGCDHRRLRQGAGVRRRCRVQARAGQLKEAKETAGEIENPDVRQSAYRQIAAVQLKAGDAAGAKGSLELAIASSEEVHNPGSKAWAYRCIAIAQARAAEVPAALKTAAGIEQAYARAGLWRRCRDPGRGRRPGRGQADARAGEESRRGHRQFRREVGVRRHRRRLGPARGTGRAWKHGPRASPIRSCTPASWKAPPAACCRPSRTRIDWAAPASRRYNRAAKVQAKYNREGHSACDRPNPNTTAKGTARAIAPTQIQPRRREGREDRREGIHRYVFFFAFSFAPSRLRGSSFSGNLTCAVPVRRGMGRFGHCTGAGWKGAGKGGREPAGASVAA